MIEVSQIDDAYHIEPLKYERELKREKRDLLDFRRLSNDLGRNDNFHGFFFCRIPKHFIGF
jgi:hypothetical protein